MTAADDDIARAKRSTLRLLALATVYTTAVLLLPMVPTMRPAAALLGVSLVFAALLRYAAFRRQMALPRFRRSIPIRFSGNLGRFTLRPLGDGRRVEVRAGAEVVAEAIATEERDELVVDLERVDDSEIDALGAAIGDAIEMVADADDDRPDALRVAILRRWGRRTRAAGGGVLRSIGMQSR